MYKNKLHLDLVLMEFRINQRVREGLGENRMKGWKEGLNQILTALNFPFTKGRFDSLHSKESGGF